ncbi:non-ribosomal peptide synthetase [Chitinophaga sp. MD30]|uniref:non-ribosomal peptide synthetase n=1 Tax=Chitinophaga sp. MD30 TaxID=2033437 RepID=UPI000BB06D2E|nr:non-ribosomal peptide synthetase [Chitinophaga sp. MD30]ASZ13281.1 hypothetical protein CK934_21120 [Chitinophaga sp. MD30]
MRVLFLPLSRRKGRVVTFFYTSGSTGHPKGIRGRLDSLSHYIGWHTGCFGMNRESRISQLAPVTFDASLKDILSALYSGGTLCVPSAGTRQQIPQLLTWLSARKVTVLQTVPTLFRLLTRSLKDSGERLSSLRHIVLAGERLYGRDVENWQSHQGRGAMLSNLYGLTETTILKSCYHITETVWGAGDAIPVGFAMKDAVFGVLDGDELCGIGEIGEVYIRSPYMSGGYLDESLNGSLFVQNPLLSDRIDMVCRTGDIGRYRVDGSLELLGRRDDQVKLHGVRVELDGVKRLLLRQEGIEQVELLLHQDEELNGTLLCYYTGRQYESTQLRHQLEQELPAAHLPGHYIWLEEFPLNVNGKVDRKRLPRPDSLSGGDNYEAPHAGLEQELSGIWQQILGVDRISRTASFFVVGGSSLKAIQLLSRIYKEYEVQLTIADIFKHTTLAAQAALIGASIKVNYEPIPPAAPQAHYPLSFAQRRLWVLHQLEEGMVAYSRPVAYLIKGIFNKEAFDKAFEQVIRRHESLRTRFQVFEGEPRQYIVPYEEMNVHVRYEASTYATNKEAAILNKIRQEGERAFDLENGPLIRIVMLQLASNEHLMVLSIHHIVSDEWSVALLLREIIAGYNAGVAAQMISRSDLRIQYRDYTHWQIANVDQKQQEARKYWHEKLNGTLPLLELPLDKPRPLRQSFRGEQLKIQLPVALKNSLQQKTDANGATLFMGLVALVNTLLYRYTGQNDIIIGMPVSGREHPDLENQVGFYVNNVVLRTYLDGTTNFDDYLEVVRETMVDAYNYQNYPFERLIEELNVVRDISRTALFDVAVIWQDKDREQADALMDQLSIDNYQVEVTSSLYDLSFWFLENTDGIRLILEYNTDLFEKARIIQMGAHFQQIMTVILSDNDAPLNSISYLSEAEKQHLLAMHTQEVRLPSEELLTTYFSTHSVTYPDRIALVDKKGSYSYSDLEEKSNKLAHRLQQHRTGKDVPVAILLKRNVWSAISIIGVLKTGAPYLPIDVSYPTDRVLLLLRDAGVEILITDRTDISWEGTTLTTDELEFTLDNLSSEGLSIVNSLEDPAYIIYTSGSSGTPKGVMVPHRALMNYLHWANHYYFQGTAGHSFGVFTSLSFDLTITSLLSGLIRGDKVFLIEEDAEAALQIVFSHEEITAVKLTPAHILLIDLIDITSTKINTAIVGGEALLEEHVNILKRLNPDMRIFNEYGPTETTVGCAVQEISSSDISIGRPIWNTQILLLDEHLQLQPEGITGEICIGGGGLALGYLRQQELTDQKFIKHPYQNGLLYRTGDRGRWAFKGELLYEGRYDEQVKIRGYRVEPGEVENILLQFHSVSQAVVIANKERTGLLAYIVPTENFERESIYTFLRQRLPAYMVPVSISILEELPLTTNGKIDKQSLPEPDKLSIAVFKEPVNDVEVSLLAVWKELLELDRISTADDFFMLGGHSLLAIKMIIAIRSALDVELTLKEIFEYTTIAALSSYILDNNKVKELPAIVAGERPAHLPLSYSQERLWFIDQMGGSEHYHISAVLDLTGQLDIAALTAAFRQVLGRHEVLRTVIQAIDGTPYQQIIDGAEWQLSVIDEDIYKQDPGALAAGISTLLLTPFDLSSDYMLRASLFVLDDASYRLVLVVHHIAFDAWSTGVLVKELSAVYAAHRQGVPAVLPALRIQYADYALWQRSYLEGALLASKLDYWRNRLGGLSPLELPLDYPRPAVQSQRGAIHRLRIDRELTADLQALSQSHGVTLFMTLLSVFKVLLYRYTGQSDICVGTPVAGRSHQEQEGLLGLFVNTLAIRSTVSGREPFTTLLASLKSGLLSDYDHQDVPFEKVVEQLTDQRDMSRSPLFQVMFLLEHEQEEGGLALADITIRDVAAEQRTSKFDLTLSITVLAEELLLGIEYCTDLFGASTIERLGGHYLSLLGAVVASPSGHIGTLPLLGADETAALLSMSHGPVLTYPADQTLLDLFREQVIYNGDGIAVIYGDDNLTYADLDKRSSQLAHYLSIKGAGHGMLIGLCTGRNLEMIVGMLGILKAGAGYVPMDPSYPADRLHYMLSDTGARLVVTHSAQQSILSTNVDAYELLMVDRLPSLTDNYSDHVVGQVSPSDVAYVIYTSGSTGRPKGVTITHGGVVNLVHAQTAAMNITSADRILQFSNYSFDASVEQIFLSLCNGSSLVLYPQGLELDIAGFTSLLEATGVTHLHATPGFLEQLPDGRLAGLKRLIAGGDVCSRELLLRWKDRVSFYNEYGPTETTVTALEYPSSISSVAPSGVVPIGRPLANVSAYILDDFGQLQPEGVTGELYLSGVQVSNGYLNQPLLNASVFVADPFIPGNRMYRTGDLCRRQSDGNILFVGRKDEQIKLRGYRIELGEIEEVLQSYDGVQQAAVRLYSVAPHTAQLLGYVVWAGERDPDGLLSYLSSKVPGYMLPTQLIDMDSFPLTVNGKLDKGALPVPDMVPDTVYAGARNELEQQLVDMWEQLLGRAPIGITDNFFSLGGHSLLIMRLLAALRKELGIEVPVKALFQYPTISALSTYLSEQPSVPLIPAIVAGERPVHLPLSYSQERLWFIDQVGGSEHYHISAVLDLAGQLDIAALTAAFRQVIERHEVLRTVIRTIDGTPYQQIMDGAEWQLRVIDEDIYKQDPGALAAGISTLLLTPFDLSSDYMLRASLFVLDDASYRLVLVVHHIAFDAWSTGVLVKELSALYAAHAEGIPAYRQGVLAVLPALRIQYADYALWQRSYLEGALLASKLNYWRNRLGGLSPLELPLDYPRPAVQSQRGAIHRLRIDRELTADLQALSQSHGVTLFMTLLSVFKVLLYRYTGQSDICVGTPVAGRSHQEQEGLLGFFVNTLAIRSTVSGREPFTTLLASLKSGLLSDYDHQDVPFEKVVEQLVDQRDMSRSPLFQVMFLLEHEQEEGGLALADITIRDVAAEQRTSKFDLTLSVTVLAEGLSVGIEYCTDLFGASTIERLGGHYLSLLSAVVASPSGHIGTLSLLGTGEAEQLELLSQGAIHHYEAFDTVADLFERQAWQTPAGVAVYFEGAALTYRELDERSNQLGHYLLAQGVGPDVLVPVCMDRSLELVISLLGVLKAGGAYVPLDPSYPEDRLGYMLSDSGASVVLSSNRGNGLMDQLFMDGQPLHGHHLHVDTEWSAVSVYPTSKVPRSATSSNIAYVIYTSGTSGRPKGVANEHGGLLNRLQWGLSYFGLHIEDRLLQKTSIGFDVSLNELCWPLVSGACLHLASPEGHKDPVYIKEALERSGITTVHFVPSMLSAFLDVLSVGDLPSLVRVLCSGESLLPHHIKHLQSKLPHVTLYNLYGPTEAGIRGELTGRLPDGYTGDLVPIGRPVSNTRLSILDVSGNPVPVGVAGELCIGGIQVARCYLNEATLTDSRFRQTELGRQYYTGDLARWQPDGNIIYLGRMDGQVKIRGYRIEKDEIVQSLLRHEAMRSGVVTVYDREGSAYLVAYYTADRSLSSGELRSYLEQWLPAYMIPTWFIQLEQLPVNNSGKLDYKALPVPDITSDVPYIPARNGLEQQLVDMWEQLLGRTPIGITDNFFSLGGHSLLIMRLLAALRKELGIEVPVKALFQYPTISVLSTYLSEQPSVPLIPAIVAGERPVHLPLSYSQERLWFIDQVGGSEHYHISAVLDLAGQLDIAALTAAFRQVIERHEVLRTVIQTIDGLPYQQIMDSADWELRVINEDIYRNDTGALETGITSLLLVPFDLSSDYMLRASLFVLDDASYRLVLVVHHIAFDAWSTGVLVKELSAVYAAHRQGVPAVLPALRIQYADYALWQRSYLEGALLASKLDYWRNRLGGLSPLELPLDYPRPAVQSQRGAVHRLRIDRELTADLQALSQSHGVTLFMTLLSVFKVLLYRYTGQSDICVGTPVAGRSHQEQEGLLGFFVNTLAIRSTVSGMEPFTTLLASLKSGLLSDYDHQDVSFEKVVEQLTDQRDMSRSPLFQVMFLLEHEQEEGGLALADITIRDVAAEQRTSKFDLTLSVTVLAEELLLGIEYCTDLFGASTIERLGGHYLSLLGAVVASPSGHIGTLPLLGADETAALLSMSHGPVLTYPADQTLLDLFREQVIYNGDGIAVIYGDDNLTYADLDKRSSQLAHYLSIKGAGHGMLIGLCTGRNLEMIVGMLGILKAGAGYVPMDPSYPADRLHYMLSDTGARLVVTHSAQQSILSTNVDAYELLMVDRLPSLTDNYSDHVVGQVSPSDVAYVIYTSGSTGRPKGVTITHGGVVNLVHAQTAAMNITSADRILQFSNYSFDASVEQIFLSLCNGSSLVLYPQGLELDITGFTSLLEATGVTHLHATPGFLEQLPDGRLAGLKRLIAGGDVCSRELLLRWKDRVSFYNEYGPTETTVTALEYPSSISSVAPSGVVPIGRPLANVSAYILDDFGQLQPEGVTGELYLSGVQVSNGYLNQPLLNASVFVADPFIPGNRMYRTGDLCRRQSDGNILFVGRKDEQIKLRGYRIELGEIEEVLQSYDGVQQAAVRLYSVAPHTAQLLGYVVWAGERDPDGLLSYLSSKVPGYMLPTQLIDMDSFPLTVNGKLDKGALPVPDMVPDTVYAGARNELEQQLVDMWEQLLGRTPIGITDNFFSLGGHSLLIMRLLAALRKELGIEVPVKALFQYPTISALSTYLSEQPSVPLIPAIVAGERPVHLPLSYSQERLWFIDQVGGSEHYHISAVLDLAGQLDIAALIAAFRQVIERHEVLRTVIQTIDGLPYQQIMDSADWELRVINEDIYRNDTGALETGITSLLLVPFDLSSDYMLRASLFLLDDASYRLVLVVHHIAFDAWSTGVLVKELSAVYAAHRQGVPAVLPALRIQYADYALWQRSYLEGALLAPKLDYWRNRLGGLYPLELPLDYPRPAVQSQRGAVHRLRIDRELTADLQALSQSHGVTLFMTLLSVFKVLLYRYTGQSDICVGTPVAGRSHQEQEGLLGFFVNTLAIRSTVSGREPFTTLLASLKSGLLSDYDHQDVPFEKVVEQLTDQRDMSRSPLFQVMFLLEHEQEEGGLALADITIRDVAAEQRTSKFDLTLSVTVLAEGLSVGIEYCTDLFGASTIERLGGHYLSLLSAVVASPSGHIGTLSLLGTGEAEQLELLSQGAIHHYEAFDTVADLFERQALQTPAGVAVYFEGAALTYRELDERSNQLGHYLLAQGVGPDVLVPVCMDRSLELVISLLGVLKAGGAYVPLDPFYPEDRLGYMLSDSGASVVLSSNRGNGLMDQLFMDGQPLHGHHLHVDTEWSAVSVYPTSKVPRSATSSNIAYVIYTSGTSGRPKGVANEHGGLLNRLQWGLSYFGLHIEDRLLQKTSIGFDVSLNELCWPLVSGACLHLASPEGHKDPVYIKEALERSGITTVHFVPSMLSAFLDVLSVGDLPSLVRVLCSGESLLPHHIKHLQSKLPHVTLYNLYGPTEAGIEVSYWQVPDGYTGDLVPIGRPVSNTRLSILDVSGNPVPVGVAGELCIGGIQVARCYLNEATLTDSRFRQTELGRQYHTGDLARWQPDGNIIYLGRMDGQVKIRGYRIEKDEIVQSLLRHEAMRSGVVTVYDREGSAYLVAYYTADRSLSSGELRSYLERWLPAYMIPTWFIQLEQLPVNNSGKLDYKALPVPELRDEDAYVSPETALEIQIADIWKGVLQVAKVGVTDNFFAVGGHSLKLIQLTQRMNQQLDWQLTLSDILRYPTIRELILLAPKEKKDDILIPLNNIYPGLPALYCCPPLVGASFIYLDLANVVEGTFNCFGWQDAGFMNKADFDQSIAIKAERFAKAFMEQDTTRVCTLLGFSFGGTVAFEVAKILEQKGVEVQLVLLDRNVSESKSRKSKTGIGDDETLREELALLENWLDDLNGSEEEKERITMLFHHNISLTQQYKQTGRINGPIRAFKSRQNIGDSFVHMKDWAKYTKGSFEHTYLKGGHYDAIRLPENLRVIAAMLSAAKVL